MVYLHNMLDSPDVVPQLVTEQLEQPAHPIIEEQIRGLQLQIQKLRLEVEMQKGTSAVESRNIADLHDHMDKLRQDVDFLQQVNDEYQGWGRINDMSQVLIDKTGIDDIVSRYGPLRQLQWGFDTVYVHERFVPQLQHDRISRTIGAKSADEFQAMSPTLKEKYRSVQILSSITIPVATAQELQAA